MPKKFHYGPALYLTPRIFGIVFIDTPILPSAIVFIFEGRISIGDTASDLPASLLAVPPELHDSTCGPGNIVVASALGGISSVGKKGSWSKL